MAAAAAFRKTSYGGWRTLQRAPISVQPPWTMRQRFMSAVPSAESADEKQRAQGSSVFSGTCVQPPTEDPVAPIPAEKPKLTPAQLAAAYGDLIKLRLSGLVVLTTMAGYAMAPVPLNCNALLFASLGTALCVASANTFNQAVEIPYDSQMRRTSTRPLVRGVFSRNHAVAVGVGTGVAGVAMLASLVNPITAALGAFNIGLYAGIYTPLKRISIYNTWVGAVVGALPPMMGWSAATGGLEAGAWVLGGVLYAWQFPHFNSLSWNLRSDYTKAGYRMMSGDNPRLCRRVALRYSLLMTPICLLAPVIDMTTWWFALDSLVLNGALAYYGRAFYGDANSQSARRLFLLSVIHLPLLLILFMLHKKPRTAPCPGTPVVAPTPPPATAAALDSAPASASAAASTPATEALLPLAPSESIAAVATESSAATAAAAPSDSEPSAPAPAAVDSHRAAAT